MNMEQRIQFGKIYTKWERGQQVSDDELWDLIRIIKEIDVTVVKKNKDVPSVINWQGRRYILDLK